MKTIITSTLQELNQKVPPLWPLTHFVAVNPFAGFAPHSFEKSVAYFKRLQDADLLMPSGWYLEEFEKGSIKRSALEKALEGLKPELKSSLESANIALTVESLEEALKSPKASAESPEVALSFSKFISQSSPVNWQSVISEEGAKWCAAYDDAGQSSWKFPWKDLGLYKAWKEAASLDKNLEIQGLKGFRGIVEELPGSYEEAIEKALQILNIPEDKLFLVLHQMIMTTLPGWAGHLRYKDRELELRGQEGTLLHELVAILLSYESILYAQSVEQVKGKQAWKIALAQTNLEVDSLVLDTEMIVRYVWQLAVELTFEEELQAGIKPVKSQKDRPDVQAVFCIDVRSEVFRRALEATSLSVQTIGFAGFFGVPIDHEVPEFGKAQARCPVILAPPIKSCEHVGNESETLGYQEDCSKGREKLRAKKRYKEGAASCFTFVETMGLGYVRNLFKETFTPSRLVTHGLETNPDFNQDLDLEAATNLAAGIITGLGIKKKMAKVVLLCGHGSETRNNPYASGLDCGACGGHSGDANARIAAKLLSRSDVRAELIKKGFDIPKDTKFIAGLHNTTTDAITLFEAEEVDSTLLAQLESALLEAGHKTALERSVKMQLKKGNKDETLKRLLQRSHDWSQVRPEWGLAGNAAFVVAPRSWSAKSSLAGRSFLHDNDASLDPEHALLEQIIGGPLVVTTWINLQYYASAVDNVHYGSGHKAIHNVVGGIGVALGNESDLRTGLAFQSVHSGSELVHKPSRLHVCIAASPEALKDILTRQDHVRELVENKWIKLTALGESGDQWTEITSV